MTLGEHGMVRLFALGVGEGSERYCASSMAFEPDGIPYCVMDMSMEQTCYSMKIIMTGKTGKHVNMEAMPPRRHAAKDREMLSSMVRLRCATMVQWTRNGE